MTIVRSQKIVVAVVALAIHVLLLCAALFVLFLFNLMSPHAIIAAVLVAALAKCIAYGAYVRRLIVQITSTPAAFHDFLVVLCGAMFVVIASFGCDFYLLYVLDNSSLAAMNADAPALETLFNCWYFSVLNFSFFGVSDIVPTTLATRALLTMETLTSFLTVVFILSDFVALRDSIRRAVHA